MTLTIISALSITKPFFVILQTMHLTLDTGPNHVFKATEESEHTRSRQSIMHLGAPLFIFHDPGFP
jgi:hypothetical protein